MSQPCRDRDIAITPHPGRVSVRFAGRIIAETDAALDLAEPGHPVRIYLPRADVAADAMTDSGTRTTCPYKGIAAHHHLRSGAETAPDAVWYYPDPCPQAAAIRDHVSFRGDAVAVERT